MALRWWRAYGPEAVFASAGSIGILVGELGSPHGAGGLLAPQVGDTFFRVVTTMTAIQSIGLNAIDPTSFPHAFCMGAVGIVRSGALTSDPSNAENILDQDGHVLSRLAPTWQGWGVARELEVAGTTVGVVGNYASAASDNVARGTYGADGVPVVGNLGWWLKVWFDGLYPVPSPVTDGLTGSIDVSILIDTKGR